MQRFSARLTIRLINTQLSDFQRFESMAPGCHLFVTAIFRLFVSFACIIASPMTMDEKFIAIGNQFSFYFIILKSFNNMKNFIFIFLAFAGLQTAAFSQGTYKINTLGEGQELWQNQSLRSENGQFTFILQTDGNLCVYKNAANYGFTPVWCTMTNGKSVKRIQMQADGNLAAYGDGGHVWSTNTFQGSNEQKGGKLVLENDGSLILYSKTGKAIWKNGNKL